MCHVFPIAEHPNAQEPGGEVVHVAVVADQVPEEIHFTANGTSVVSFLTVIRTSLDSGDSLEQEAVNRYLDAKNASLQSLWQEHAQAWQTLWESGMEVDQDLGLAQGLHLLPSPPLTSRKQKA